MGDKELLHAVVPWVRDSTVDELTRRLQEVLRQNPETQRRSIVWRPNSLNDFRPMYVPAMAERLVRWDPRHPDDVFSNGFVPRRVQAWVHDEMDLWTYVQRNVPSIFVSTARYYRNPRNVPTRWMPRNRNSIFEYEVLAPGGIDVNECLGNHNFANQREVAFPGGIRREFIRSAREYNEQGHVVRLWENGFFLETFEVLAILDLIPDPPAGSGVEDRYWTGPSSHDARPRRDVAPHDVPDIMRTAPGEPTEEYAALPWPMMQPRAAFLRARDYEDSESHGIYHGEAFFFTANQSLRMRIRPATTTDVLLDGPRVILRDWPPLKTARFSKVDAVLGVPGSRRGESYFFCQDSYALIRVNAARTHDSVLLDGPHKITDKWPALRAASFNTVDAVLPHPRNSYEAYFFCGDRYALIRLGSSIGADSIVNGPKVITSEWPSLRQARFSTVDVALPNPDNSDEAYFFNGDQYVLVKIMPGTNSDSIVNGPKNVAQNWSALREAGFYHSS